MFENLKQLMELKKTMTEMKNRLDGMEIKVQSKKNLFEITVSGSQEVKEIKILNDLTDVKKEDLEKDLKELFNKAIKDSQKMAAQAMGGLAGLGGL